jgi:AGZA family xanthine/uracil permease-like MFS transporter
MENIINKFFKIKERGGTYSKEIIGGLITFVAMIYILPTNAGILSDMGMSYNGVFAMTALLSAFVTLLMGFVAKFPIALSAGMGLNAFLVYSLPNEANGGYSWQAKMLLLTIAGIIFFVMSLTPARTYLINKIPKDLKLLISAGLGAFLCFVGLRGSGIVDLSSGIPSLGNLANPAILIPFLGVLLIVTLMFVRNKWLSNLAIPVGVFTCAVIAIIVNYAAFGGTNSSLPIFDSNWGINGLDKVLFYGYIDSASTNTQSFGTLCSEVFSNPLSYIAIFSLIFVNLFDTTATLLAVGRSSGLLNENGELVNARGAILIDATGALICGPLGTSTVTSFAESNVGVSYGAKTGLMSVVVGLLFLLSAFIYPVFSIFASWSVTAPALICVGGVIFANNIKDVDLKDYRIGIVTFFMIIFMLLTYSLSTGLGIAIIIYTLINLVSGRYKENNVAIYVISGLFVLSFTLTAVMTLIK